MNILDELPVGVMLVSTEGSIDFINPKVASIFGYIADELIGSHFEKLIPQRFHHVHSKNASDYMKSPSHRAMGDGRTILPGVKKNGQEIDLEIGLVPFSSNDYKGVLVTMIEATNPILKVAACNDFLTGLPNRNLFLSHGETLRNLAIRNQTWLSIMFIDLDGFKAINDHYGHDVGDTVLCQVANILRDSTRKNDIIARLGGDEFILCFYGVSRDMDIEKIAQNLIDKISAIHINNVLSLLSASVGVVSFTHNNLLNIDLNSMINKADSLMYKAKHSGKGQFFHQILDVVS